MSIRTWKREFYVPPSRWTKANAASAVLQKYVGTRRTALKRHGVKKNGRHLTDGMEIFYFGADTCALCKFYCKVGACSPECPLKTKSGQPCFGLERPYSVWADTGNPEPLVRALQRAIKK